MKTTLRLTGVSFLILVGLTSYGQDKNTNLNQQDLRNLDASFTAPNFNVAFEGTYGTPYLYSEWSKGIVIMSNNDTLKNQDLKYDVYQDQLILKDSRSGQAIMPIRGVVKSFIMNDSLSQEHIFINTSGYNIEESEGSDGYYEILHSGKYLLLTKHRKSFIEADYEGAYSANRPYDEFKIDAKQYAFIGAEGSLMELGRSKKGVLKSLKDDGTLEKIVKERKLDLKKEEDLISLFIVIDSM